MPAKAKKAKVVDVSQALPGPKSLTYDIEKICSILSEDPERSEELLKVPLQRVRFALKMVQKRAADSSQAKSFLVNTHFPLYVKTLKRDGDPMTFRVLATLGTTVNDALLLVSAKTRPPKDDWMVGGQGGLPGCLADVRDEPLSSFIKPDADSLRFTPRARTLTVLPLEQWGDSEGPFEIMLRESCHRGGEEDVCVMATPDTLPEKLREVAAEQRGCAVEQVKVVFGGKQLEDGEPIGPQGVADGAVVTFFLKMKKPKAAELSEELLGALPKGARDALNKLNAMQVEIQRLLEQIAEWARQGRTMQQQCSREAPLLCKGSVEKFLAVHAAMELEDQM